MNDPWLAHVSADPTEQARSVARAHAAFLSGGSAAGQELREVVAQSWLRSARAWPDHPTWMREFIEILRSKSPA